MTAPAPILELNNLEISLPKGADRPLALESLDLTIAPGEIVCLVGESGSGKSLCAGAIMRLLPEPHVRVTGGAIRFMGEELRGKSEAEMRRLRGADIAMIFQEPMTALNPQKTVGWQLDEVLRLHTRMNRAERKARAIEMLDRVHIPDPDSAYNAYPHQVSGGQRQRVMIAMALVMSPKLIIADEPTTALDVTTQAQVLKLLADLRERLNLSLLFVTHDLRVAAQLCDRIIVMQKGEIVESGQTAEVFANPQHPYTQNLLSSIPGRHWTPPSLQTDAA
ncbi:UNVERIFIED_CONTAM: hypothetical protein GTU68_019848 [Idotea baltica]|nr:hypothetical protein [Idotea baltica]